jgi:hypothetical protein
VAESHSKHWTDTVGSRYTFIRKSLAKQFRKPLSFYKIHCIADNRDVFWSLHCEAAVHSVCFSDFKHIKEVLRAERSLVQYVSSVPSFGCGWSRDPWFYMVRDDFTMAVSLHYNKGSVKCPNGIRPTQWTQQYPECLTSLKTVPSEINTPL